MKRTGFNVMARLIGLVKPLTGYMILAIIMGLVGNLCAAFITIVGGYGILNVLNDRPTTVLFSAVLFFALVRGFLRYAEQACNHFIAFKLLALIRDRVFGALRRLCPAKLEGKDKGNLISVITSDIELLEVFYAHTISPIAIAFLFTVVMVCFIGINGRSGSGKSTLLKLFMRFWQVQQGTVRISGRNVDDINTANLRNLESFVTQETHLFHDSIRNNLALAKLDATDEEIIAACKKASVHDFIMSLPKGYDTEVGELGETISGGERQRLGLARAYLHDAPFLLLDEPTSNLDSLNEAVILKALHEECADRTVVLVSHRKSTMGIADMVYSVEHGRMS